VDYFWKYFISAKLTANAANTILITPIFSAALYFSRLLLL
jgi:hypothetical protein